MDNLAFKTINAWPVPSYLDQSELLSGEEREVLEFILPLSSDYPGIEAWFRDKVTLGLRNGTRKIIRVDRYGQIAAVGIGKMEEGERKICTVRVAPEFVGRGFGLRIFDGLMDWLGTDRPHATVSERKLIEFERIFERYGYKLTSVRNGLYRTGTAEYLFNEPKARWL